MQLPRTGKTAAGITLAGTLLLMALLAYINLVSAAFNIIILLAVLVPPALTLPGLLSGSSRSYQWLCFVALFYMTHGILQAFTPGRLLTGLAETVICLVLFVSAIIFIRAGRRNA